MNFYRALASRRRPGILAWPVLRQTPNARPVRLRRTPNLVSLTARRCLPPRRPQATSLEESLYDKNASWCSKGSRPGGTSVRELRSEHPETGVSRNRNNVEVVILPCGLRSTDNEKNRHGRWVYCQREPDRPNQSERDTFYLGLYWSFDLSGCPAPDGLGPCPKRPGRYPDRRQLPT